MNHTKKNLAQRAFNTCQLLFGSSSIGVKFSRSKETHRNWGDALNGYLVPRLAGKKVLHVSDYFNMRYVRTISAIGSVLDNNRTENLHVWGSGFKSGQSSMHVLPTKVWAVRGKYTRQRLLELGMSCPSVYGDPALILPRYYQPRSYDKKYKFGVVPHYADKGNRLLQKLYNDSEVLFIDIESDIEQFVDSVAACQFIVSSSLHGLIAADAYGIPRVWLKISDNIVGGDFKFYDYFSSTDVPDISPVAISDMVSLRGINTHAVQPQKIADVQHLLDAFPH